MITSVTTCVDFSKDPNYILSATAAFLRLKPAEMRKRPCELSVVFDIDETLMYLIEARGELALQPVGRALYLLSKSMGFRIVFITARVGTPASLRYVQDQLQRLDYEYDALFMISRQHQHDDCPSACKLRSRLSIGLPVILNVGNRTSDLFATDHESDPVLLKLNPRTYYFFAGQAPDILCLKLPTDCPTFIVDESCDDESAEAEEE